MNMAIRIDAGPKKMHPGCTYGKRLSYRHPFRGTDDARRIMLSARGATDEIFAEMSI